MVMTVVLIAEDNDDINAMLVRLFTGAGFTVLTAPDGKSALDLATRQHPDVVVTDQDMPGMTGLQLCQAIRADPALRGVPVAILSGSLQQDDPRAVDVHACGVWLKPIANAALVAAVRGLLAAGRHDHGDPSPCPLSAASA
jgi:CheY-like chemotaxis protein